MNKERYLLQYLRERDRGTLYFIFLLVVIVYLPFISNPFIFDDLHFFGGSSASDYLTSDFNFRLRYLSYSVLYLTWELFLDLPIVYHLLSLFIHAINTVLIFFLLNKFIQSSSDYSKTPVWLICGIFAVHPVCTYAVGYTVQLSILIATMFTLAMFLSFIKGMLSQKYMWLICSAIFYFLAVFAKEHSLPAPIITFGLFLLFREKIHPNKKALLLTWSSYALIGVLVLLSIKGVFGSSYEHDAAMLLSNQALDSNVSPHLLSILTQSGLFFQYLFFWMFPNPTWMSIDMRPAFDISLNFWSLSKIFAFSFYGIVASLLLICSRHHKLLGFSLLYPWVFFLVEFSTVRIQEPFVLYRSYLWMPGMLVLGLIAISKIKNRIIFTFVASSSLIILIACSWNRLWIMGNEYRLWNDAAILVENKTVSGAARIYYNRGKALLNQKEWARSIPDFHRVIAIHPNIYQAYFNLGIAYSNLRLNQSAIEAYNKSIEINPDYASGYFGKGMLLNRLGREKESREVLRKACDLNHQASCIILSYTQKDSD